MNAEKEEIEIDLGQIFSVLLKKAWLIILAVIIFGTTGYIGSKILITPMYQSNVKLYVNNANISVGGTKLSISSSDIMASQSLVETYIVILQTRNTLLEVIDVADLDYSYNKLKSMISANSVNGTEIFQIVVKSADPAEAKLIANTIGEILPDKISDIVEESSVKLVDLAVEEPVPFYPSNMKNAMIGAMIGAFLVIAIIVIKYLLNQEIKDEDELSNLFDIPVLAVIPDNNKASSKSGYYAKQ